MADQFANPFDVPLSSEPQNAQSQQPAQAAQASSTNPFDIPLQSEQAAQPATQPSVFSRAVSAVSDWGRSVAAPFAPPADHREEVAATYGGPQALVAYRAARTLVDGVENVIKAPAKNYQQAKADFARGVQDFANRDWRNVASDVVSTASDLSDVVPTGIPTIPGRTRELSEGARPGGDLTTPLVRTALDTGAALALDKVAGGGEGDTEEATQPSVVQKVLKGEKVAQAPAQAALRSGVQAGAEEAGIADESTVANIQNQGLRSVMDEPIANLQAAKKAVYSTVDQAAGTDLKTLYGKLDAINDKIDLEASGSPEEARLEAQRASQMQTIDDAKAAARASGVDVDEALAQGDAMHTQEMALRDLNKKVFNNQSVVSGNALFGTPETINVDSAIKSLERLNQATKYGPNRLVQALGEDGAEKLMDDMYAAQRLGVKALRAQNVAKMIGKYVGLPLVGTAAGAAAYQLMK